ncbi:mavicyanin-like protein [Cinnamomum micranthum f. kanehirae]|uniref:Mavicyanin-like protein n=1 Tax=Cinnamomum micranthum f. kanehirae TaxID=337451 RepID=A0A3S3QA08_9MAGN|nr:mavicyanin-like protein [Cinnamomum micranthum f. kanehirae]
MASKQVYAILAMMVAVLPATTLAKVFVVGDEHGWTINFDYKLWAADKDFWVGAKLVFHDPVGVHSVFKVNGTAFQECIKPPPSEALICGNDIITLLTRGLKWYFCGVGKHSEVGSQKLAISVQSISRAPAPAPSPFGA